MILQGREILIYYAILYEGEWKDIYDALINRQDFDNDEARAVISNINCKVCTILDPEYPSYLKNIRMPPLVLFYYGDISLLNDINNNLSVVGSRECSTIGIQITERIVNGVAKKLNIVSGMAKGIDAVAHEACLNKGGKTIAVLGSGIDRPYPISNRRLYETIKQKGLVISEYPGLVEPKSKHFPFRNRLIATISKGTLITEAKMNSGSSITAEFALENGRSVMAIPYPPGTESLCNYLIHNGATLIERAQEVLEELNDYAPIK